MERMNGLAPPVLCGLVWEGSKGQPPPVTGKKKGKVGGIMLMLGG